MKKIENEKHELEVQAREAMTWNESVKLATMLLHWKLVDNYRELLHLMQMHQKWAEQCLFQQNDNMLQQLLDKWPVEDTAPRIWACFHVGPYALISRALIKKGLGVAVLLKEEVYDEQHDKYIEGFQKSFDRDPFPSDLQFIRAGSAGSLAKLKHCLAEGMHVVCFVDGEEGGASYKSKTTVRLHGMEMEVRVGVATLAHWANVPIRPLVLSVTDDVLNVVSPADYFVSSKEDYSRLMQYCFNTLTELTPSELLQWQFIPVLFDRLLQTFSNDHIPDEVWVKDALWMPLLLPEKYLLLDLRTGRGVFVSESEHQKIYGGFRKVMTDF